MPEEIAEPDTPPARPVSQPLSTRFGYFLVSFLLSVVWTYITTDIAARWYFIINGWLNDSLTGIDSQPLWGKILQLGIANSNWAILVACIFRWGIKRREWWVPLGFWLGIVAVYIYVFVSFSISMRNFN